MSNKRLDNPTDRLAEQLELVDASPEVRKSAYILVEQFWNGKYGKLEHTPSSVAAGCLHAAGTMHDAEWTRNELASEIGKSATTLSTVSQKIADKLAAGGKDE